MLRDLGARLGAPRVAVLGPPAVGPRGALRPVSGRPARLLVALASARRPCSIDALSDAAWGEKPPATYRSALHVHLGALRRLLAEQDEHCGIERVADGYRLVLGACELDANLALDLVDEATRLLAHDPTASLELAEEALGLWRGEPFCVDGEAVDASSSHQLEAARRDAEEVLVEALLRTEQASRAESIAARLVDDEPLREHRWAQLLRARFLIGRTADALATYRLARESLVENLGIEPGPELQALETAILMQGASGVRLPAQPDPQPQAPPPTAGLFVGRERELRRVASALIEARRVVILGPPGVGKSRLAIEAARAVAGAATAWIGLGEVDVAATRVVLEWAHRHPDGVVILDNAQGRSTVQLVRDLNVQAPTVGVIVTSRAPLGDAMPLELLGPLEVPDPTAEPQEIEATRAAQMLRAALEELAPNADLTASEVAMLAVRAGGLPLALRLTASAARAVPVGDLVCQPPSAADDEIDRATRTVTELLSGEARRAFADLSALSGAFDAAFGARVCGVSTTSFLRLVIELVDHGLLQASPDRLLPYVILEPIRAVAARQLDTSGRRDDVLDCAADGCLERARELSGTRAPVDLGERLAADLPRHREALAHLARQGDADRALRLACYLDAPMYALGWWREKSDLLDAALSVQGEPSITRARAHVFRARPGPMHQLDLGHAARAEEMARALGHDRLAAYSSHVRSIGLWWQGETHDSVELARQAITVLDDGTRSFEWREACKHLGVALVLDGRPEEGLAQQHAVLAVLRELPRAEFNVAHNLAYLGHCHRYLGDDTAAWADWSEARDLCRAVSNRGTAIHIDLGLAEIAVDRGDHLGALERVGEALDLIGASRATLYEPWAWTIAMRAHAVADERENAIGCARHAVAPLAGAPPGETVRLAVELAALALRWDQPVPAARLLGLAAATPDRRELPFPSPAEGERRRATERSTTDQLGAEAERHTDAGRRCTIAEAAGELIAPPAVDLSVRTRPGAGRRT